MGNLPVLSLREAREGLPQLQKKKSSYDPDRKRRGNGSFRRYEKKTLNRISFGGGKDPVTLGEGDYILIHGDEEGGEKKAGAYELRKGTG